MSSRRDFDVRSLADADEAKAFGKDLAAELKSDDVASLAAAVSFKIVLALFPALLAAVAIFALVITPQDIADLLTTLPKNVVAVVEGQLGTFIEQAASGGIALAGIAAGLWAASGAAATLNRALTRAYDEVETRKFVGARGAALGVTIALLVALIAIAILLVAGASIEDRIIGALPLTDLAAGTVDALATLGRYLVAIILLMVLFAFIYWIGPDFEDRPTWRWVTPGAAIAVVVWLLASFGFGWYVSNFGSYTDSDSVYGPLGSAIVFMLWLQLSMFALLIGAEINQVLVMRVRRKVGDLDSAGSVGQDAGDDGFDAVATDDEPADASSKEPSHLGGRVRAMTTPTPTRSRSDDRSSASASQRQDDGANGTDHSDASDRGSRGRSQDRSRDRSGRSATGAVRVSDHGGSTSPANSGTATTSGTAADDDRRADLPTATVVGASVAALSAFAGLAGLLRRLRE